MSGTYQFNGNTAKLLHNEPYVLIAKSDYDVLKKENEILREALSDVLNYLHWSGDSLKGDDLIGDQNLTKIYNEKIEIIEKALENVK